MRLPSLIWLVAAGCGFSPREAPRDAPGVTDDVEAIDTRMPDAPPDITAVTAWRKPITIHAAMVTGTQTDFPVWIDLVDSDIAMRATADGSDIYFTAADGSALDDERTHWDSAAMRLEAWVRLPTLDSGADTTIYVNYGNLTRAIAPNPAGVFRNGFNAVWHLDDTLASTAIAEATGTHTGTASGLAATAHVAAQLGGGLTFGGGTAEITFKNTLTGNGASTFSAWVNQATTNHTSSIVMIGTGMPDQARFLYGGYGSTASIGIGQFNDDWAPNNRIDQAGWVLVHWVLEGTNKKNSMYRNGMLIAGSPHAAMNAANTMGTTGIIGNAPSPTFGMQNGMAGTIDEVRIATVARDATWIATEYANQSSPSTFYAVGAEQGLP